MTIFVQPKNQTVFLSAPLMMKLRKHAVKFLRQAKPLTTKRQIMFFWTERDRVQKAATALKIPPK